MRAPGKVCLVSAALLAAGCGTTSGGGGAGAFPTPTPSGSPPPTPTPTPTPEGPGNVFTVAPAAASQHVFVANPENNDVADIDTSTLHIDVIPVGVKPLDLRVSPSGSYLATFNELSHDVSLVNLTGATPLVTPLAVRPVTNAMFTSPLATHGICIYTAARDTGTTSGGSTSPDEVSIVDFIHQTVVSAVVGALPRQVAFTPDDAKGFVLSDGLLAEIDLTQPSKPRRFIALAADPTNAPQARQV